MKGITKKQLTEIKQVDLLTYLMNYDPNELIKNGRSDYITRTHGSLHISNGLWTWWAKGIGGRSALDYLIKVQDYSFLDAAHHILSCILKKTPSKVMPSTLKKDTKHSFKLPLPNYGNNELVIDYLCNKRLIHPKIVEYCIQHYYLYESKGEHAAIFVGYDEDSKSRYAMKRSIDETIKQELYGSDKRYCFSITPNKEGSKLHVFESAIEVLSYISIQMIERKNWQCDNYLSIGGATKIGKNKDNIEPPIALTQYLKQHKDIQKIDTHLNNDEAGHEATYKIQMSLKDAYEVFDDTPKHTNDINDLLVKKVKNRVQNKERER